MAFQPVLWYDMNKFVMNGKEVIMDDPSLDQTVRLFLNHYAKATNRPALLGYAVETARKLDYNLTPAQTQALKQFVKKKMGTQDDSTVDVYIENRAQECFKDKVRRRNFWIVPPFVIFFAFVLGTVRYELLITGLFFIAMLCLGSFKYWKASAVLRKTSQTDVQSLTKALETFYTVKVS